MKKLFQSGKKAFDNATQKLSRELESGFNVVSEVVNGLPILVSFERLKKQTQKFDEKHYFVIPMQNCDTKFSLHTMRVLPEMYPKSINFQKEEYFIFQTNTMKKFFAFTC